MTTLSAFQIAQYAQGAGFSGNGLLTVVEIALQESGGVTDARNVNTDGSIDRGLLQFNNFYHPEVSDACADDPACALQAAYRETNGGTDFSAWSLDFTANRLAPHAQVAQQAIAQLGASGHLGVGALVPASDTSSLQQALPVLIALGVLLWLVS